MSNSATLPVVILGGGGHASVLAEICIEQGRQILAVASPEPLLARQIFQGLRHITDDEVLKISVNDVELVNGIGGLPGSHLRKQVAVKFSKLGYRFATLVSSSAIISRTVKLDEGVQVLPRATINTGVSVGAHSIINSCSLVEHDCSVESFVHLAPSATICGGTVVREGAQIGPCAVVTKGLEIGAYSVVGAGASVVRTLDSYSKVLPARTYTGIWSKG